MRINDRLAALERRTASRRVIAGLGAFYDLIANTEKVGGGRALLDRLDAGNVTDSDRTAMAAVPGGARAIREHLRGLERFYGGMS